MKMRWPLFWFLLLLLSCAQQHRSSPCREEVKTQIAAASEAPYCLYLFVDARGLEGPSTAALCRRLLAEAESSRVGSFGHAWIRLEGEIEGEKVVLEGGHSGETGRLQPRYFEGVMNYLDYGYAHDPQGLAWRYEPNPIRYLWEPQPDGYFQEGNGGHQPTHVAILPLDRETFDQIRHFVEEEYDFSTYHLLDAQCANFVAAVAKIAGLEMGRVTALPIAPRIWIGGSCYRLWEDARYASLPLMTPDTLAEHPAFYSLDLEEQQRFSFFSSEEGAEQQRP